MKALSHRGVVIAGIIWLLGSGSEVLAGDVRHLPGHRSGCNCGNSGRATVCAAPVYGAHSYGAPVFHSAPMAECDCACSAAVPSCCGIGGGLTQLGNLYGFGGGIGGIHHGPVGYGGHSVGAGFHGGGVSAGGGLTGFEGLPNMDGGGINHRYPYHSYRRPWAHPGPPSTNVSIVW